MPMIGPTRSGLAELSTRQIVERDAAEGLKENEVAAMAGGGIAKKARLELETRTKQKIATGENALPPRKALLQKK